MQRHAIFKASDVVIGILIETRDVPNEGTCSNGQERTLNKNEISATGAIPWRVRAITELSKEPRFLIAESPV